MRHDSAVTHQLVRMGDRGQGMEDILTRTTGRIFTKIISTRTSDIVTRSDIEDTIMGRLGLYSIKSTSRTREIARTRDMPIILTWDNLTSCSN